MKNILLLLSNVIQMIIYVQNHKWLTKDIFDLHKWHQNTKLQTFLQQILIAYKTFTVGIKTKNLPRRTGFG